MAHHYHFLNDLAVAAPPVTSNHFGNSSEYDERAHTRSSNLHFNYSNYRWKIFKISPRLLV